MRAAGLEPLTAYPGAHAPWPCRCQRCHRTVTPRYRAVRAGSGCRYCNDTAINPEAAASLMREAGLEPLEQYPGSLRPWKCRCTKCGRTVQPCYSTIHRGSGGCRWCRSSGFKSSQNAIVYLITHPRHGAAKIGITDADRSRLKKHSQRGWQVLAEVQVPGERALSIEKGITRLVARRTCLAHSPRQAGDAPRRMDRDGRLHRDRPGGNDPANPGPRRHATATWPT